MARCHVKHAGTQARWHIKHADTQERWNVDHDGTHACMARYLANSALNHFIKPLFYYLG